MRTIIVVALTLSPISALAQDFVPITIDAARYQQIDEAIGQFAMPRQAHFQWQQLWQQLERQAIADKAQADARSGAEKKNK